MAHNNRNTKKPKITADAATTRQQQQPVVVEAAVVVAEERTGNMSKKRKNIDQEQEEAVVTLAISPRVTSSHGTTSGIPTVSATANTTVVDAATQPWKKDVDVDVVEIIQVVTL